MASSAPSNVKFASEKVEIDLAKKKVTKLDPAPANSSNSGTGAPIHDAHKPLLHCEVSNEYAAKHFLSSNSQLKKEFKECLDEHHEACVKVISGIGEQKIRGSGILFKTSETSIMLVTAAHIMKDENNVTIVLEIEYDHTERENIVIAKRKTIKLQNQSTNIEKGADIATLALADDVSKYIIERVRKFPLPSPALHDRSSEEFMIIHYSDGDFKQVSTGEREGTPGNHQPLKTRIHIQAGEGASGAPVFNFQGDVVAILRSHDKSNDMLRYFTSIDRSQHNKLHDALQEPFEEPEGKQFEDWNEQNQKKLLNHGLVEKVEDAAISLTVIECLGKGGLYKDTKKCSKKKIIDSDHFPPHDAFKRAKKKNEKCPTETVIKKFFRTYTTGTRQGEDNLPAITIPKVIHLILETTKSKSFRKKQADLMASGGVYDAIVMNFDDYHEKGLFKRCNYKCTDTAFEKLMNKYYEGFVEALKVHEDLGFIKDNEKQKLEKHILAFTKQNENDSQLSLKEDRRIILKTIEDYSSGN